MVPNQEFAEPPAEWLAESGKGTPTVSRTPSVEELHAMALPLDDDQRLRLVARLWKSLPADHRAALLTLQLEDNHDESGRIEPTPQEPSSDTGKPTLYGLLFDRRHASDLYSAPRRFDLATIFVVTAAYSMLFGAMSTFNDYFGPVTQVAVGVLVTTVAVTQALYKDAANPRGVSVVTGSITQTVILVVLRVISPYYLPGPLFLVIVLYGIIGGAISGYLSGTLVGGVFLVADMLRGKFEGRNADESPDEHTLTNTTTADEYYHE